MRKFINKSASYGLQFNFGEIYNEDYVQINTGKKVLQLAQMYPQDWEEVTEPKPIQLPNLTKREYFAGLAMQGLIANAPNGHLSNFKEGAPLAVEWADELLKQLENGK